MIGATAWIALGIAAVLVYRSEQHIARLTVSSRIFDQHAREAADALVDARVAQQAYVAAGQGIGFWMPKVSGSTDTAQSALAMLREQASAAAQTPLDQAAATTTEFVSIEQRVREYLKSSQLLMAADVIFTEGNEAAANAVRQVAAAAEAEHQALDATEAAIRKQEALTAIAAAAVAGVVVLLLVPPVRRAAPAEEIDATAATPPPTALVAPRTAPAPAAPSPPPATAVKLAASLATDFGRVRDLDELTRVLGKAADAMDASGIMVWMGSPGGGDVRVVLAHGYAPEVLAKMPPVRRSADNAAAAAYRSGTLQIVLARPGTSSGAVVAPILTAEGCIGALSAEIRHRAETSEAVQALAQICAAHLAGVLASAPAAEAGEAKAVAQG
jgi:hypothetical protein